MNRSHPADTAFNLRRIGVVGAVLLMAAPFAPGAAPAPPSDTSSAVSERVDAALDALESSGDFAAAERQLSDLFDAVIAHTSDRDSEPFRTSATAIRIVRQLGAAEKTPQIELLKYLRTNPDLAQAIVFTAKPELEDMNEVYGLLERLPQERGDQTGAYPNLAAAICVVHDKPLRYRVNEHSPAAPDAVSVFDFFVRNEKKMFFGLTEVPPQLLIHVVDAAASIEELQWAVDRYAGDPAVGRRFFDIEYDENHYRTGAPKKSTLAGWGLPNILQHGGVCAVQAYFATTVGKAIGVPAAYTRGRGGDVSHAWVGFLQSDGRRRVWWNFEMGRYDSYRGVRGIVYDPQIRRFIDDSAVSLLADFSMSDPEDRYAVAAFTDGAIRLMEIEKSDAEFSPEPIVEPPRKGERHAPRGAPGRRGASSHRGADVGSILDLLEAGLKKAPGYAPGWFAVRDLAAEGKLTLERKKYWASVLDRLCAKRYPDFSLAILIPMIESVDDLAQQNDLWNRTFQNYGGRHDLAAAVRMEQAEMWEDAGNLDMAGQCYMDVINRFANAGPFVISALKKAEQLLRNANRAEDVVNLYAGAWRKIQRPEQMAGNFFVQSNWYQVGKLYAERLEESGRSQEAAQVRAGISGG